MSAVLSLFAPATAQWFRERIGTPTKVQEEGWPKIAEGGHVLISAPTGTGKTLSAFLVFIDRLKAEAARGELEPTLQVIYISPLKSLGNDIRENLRRPLSGIEGAELTVAIRTGDTTAVERRQMASRPPHILITTPESLYLLLTSQSGRRMLCTARAIILDELHAMIDGKRGAHLMLSLARLDGLCGRHVQRIGLSATIDPLDAAARYLASPDPVSIVAPKMHKSVEIEVNSPLPDMRVLPEGTIWPELARSVYEHSQNARTVIAFVEGRAQAERLAHGVNLLGGSGYARTHHGCVSKEQRLEAENQLRSGELRVLVATSSMELGIDVGEVDLVLQVGFPRSISSTMQRLGRAGHNPGRTSVMHMFPHTVAESVLCGLTAKVALEGGIERANPPRKCLDVVAQHLVSMAADSSYTVDDVMETLSRADCFRDVTREEVREVLRMLAGDFEHQLDRPARPRLLFDRIHDTIAGDAYSRMLALSAGGTIPDRGMFAVRTADGAKLGELDEEFVFEARVGDKFLLGAFAWRITEFRRDSVVVAPTNVEGAQSPFWKGDSVGRTFETGLRFGKLLRGLTEAKAAGELIAALRDLRLDVAMADNAYDFLIRQIQSTGCLPDDRTILVEHFTGASGEHQMMVHSIFGGRVNAGLSLLTKEMTQRLTGMDIMVYDGDDGFLLQGFGNDRDLPDGVLQRIDPGTARGLLTALLPATPTFNMAFRYNAGRALMMGTRQGRRVPLWVQRLRGAQVLGDAVLQADHPLMQETKRECLEDYWDLMGLETVLRGIRSGAIAVREMHLREPSPMSLPLRRSVELQMMYDYFPTPSNAFRAVDQALAETGAIPPAPEQLEKAAARLRGPQDEQQLHSLLMAEGDLVAGEVDAPVAWLESLAAHGRALYIEPGLWIAAEQEQLYREALIEDEAAARQRIVRRCLRFRGPQNARSLWERYFWEEEIGGALLAALEAEGIAVRDGDAYYHQEVYGRAQRATVAMRRAQIETMPPERYAALLAQRMRVSGGAAEQLEQSLHTLMDQPYPPALWESVLLPARAPGYRPALLDALLAQGTVFWRMEPGERPMLAFHRQEDIDWTRGVAVHDVALSEDERRLVDALTVRGASFAQSLSGVLPGRSPLEALQSLAEKGLARADSFVPVRQWIEKSAEVEGAKKRARARATTLLSGRWELTRPMVAPTIEEKLERAFDRAAVLCRETAQGLPWADALQTLRVWEYTGRVRRGYFVEGLSGAQFVRENDFASVVLALREPVDDTVWLNAADPAQAWGRALAHRPERAFMCVPGTAVALCQGEVVAVMERNGQTLRAFDLELLPEAMKAFVRDYQQRRVFAARTRITVKQYPKEAAEALSEAGFARQMLDFELWPKRGSLV